MENFHAISCFFINLGSLTLFDIGISQSIAITRVARLDVSFKRTELFYAIVKQNFVHEIAVFSLLLTKAIMSMLLSK